MTDYLNDTFDVRYGSKKYRDNWEKVFGASEEDASPDTPDTPSQPSEVHPEPTQS